MSGVPFPQMGVFFVSREPVRHAGPLGAFAQVRSALEATLGGRTLPGSLSVTVQNRFAIAACPQGLGAAPESSIAEVYEYDPVRFQALVIGLVEPPPETPVHWIARRVNPQARLVAVVPSPPNLKARVRANRHPRGYLGDTNTLLDIGRLVKGRPLTLIDRVGLVLVAEEAKGLARSLRGALQGAPKPARPTGNG